METKEQSLVNILVNIESARNLHCIYINITIMMGTIIDIINTFDAIILSQQKLGI